MINIDIGTSCQSCTQKYILLNQLKFDCMDQFIFLKQKIKCLFHLEKIPSTSNLYGCKILVKVVRPQKLDLRQKWIILLSRIAILLLKG